MLRRHRFLVVALIVVVAAGVVLLASSTQPDLLGIARPRSTPTSGPPAPTAGAGVAAQPPTGADPGPGVAPPSSAEPTTDPATSVAVDPIDPQAAAAVAAEQGISIAEAMRRLGRERASADVGNRILAGLRGRTGGFYLDRDGQLVVTTLDQGGDATARAGGAKAQRVDDSSARMEEIMQALDRQATDKGPGSVQGWYIDVPNNTVVVTATEGATDPAATGLLDRARAFGASVRIEFAPADQIPRPAVYLVGGVQYVMTTGQFCSVGFNTRTSTGYNVVLTAGHCLPTTGWITRNGYQLGRVRTADFPSNDYGTFWNEYPSYWVPSVSVSKYNGTFVNIRGSWSNPPVGATVCKSGRTTGYTCGVITALNQTVTYPEGTIYQLVRHTACVEGGDSGGSNISSGRYALGVTSGASTPKSTGLCLSKSGQQNVSWYQPITEALTANGLTLLSQP